MTDGRLSPKEFEAKYGRVHAMSLWGARWVGSALTRQHYIWFNHTAKQYVIEKR